MTKTIDMSVFVNQDFDCEYTDGEFKNSHVCRPLNAIYVAATKCHKYQPKTDGSVSRRKYRHCRPRLNHWHFNDGSMVLPDGLAVLALRRDGETFRGETKYCKESQERIIKNGEFELTQSYWPDSHPNDWDIIAVKILGLASRYKHKGMSEVIL